MSGRRLGVGVAAAAGVAGVLYSRRRIARGALGPLGVHLATWVPSEPPTVPLRLAARLWAAPITAVGLLVGALAGVAPRIRDGVVVFAPARGLTGRVIRRRGFAATGLGHVVIAIEEPSPALLAHELVHVRQAERFGPLMAPVYLVLLAVHGYHQHPMERAARLAAGVNGKARH